MNTTKQDAGPQREPDERVREALVRVEGRAWSEHDVRTYQEVRDLLTLAAEVRRLHAACEFKDRTNAGLQARLVGESHLHAEIARLRAAAGVADAAPPAEQPDARRKVIFYMDGKEHYIEVVDAPTLTACGLEIKAAAGVAADYSLAIDRHPALGGRAVGNAEAVVLDENKPTNFTCWPPATMGGIR